MSSPQGRFYSSSQATLNNRLLAILATAILVVLAILSGCSSSATSPPPPATATATAQFATDPATVVLYVDIHYPGIPVPTKSASDRYCPSLPALRVWGDGYAFLDRQITNLARNIRSGQLTPGDMSHLLNTLDDAGFFTQWPTPGPPNPAGTWVKVGAQLEGRPLTEHVLYGGEPPVHDDLFNYLQFELKPLAAQPTMEPRVLALLQQDAKCNAYMATPAPTPTMPRLATLILPPTPTPVALAGAYPPYPPPSTPAPGASGGYPVPPLTVTLWPTPIWWPTATTGVTPVPYPISPANAAALRASTQVAPPSFEQAEQQGVTDMGWDPIFDTVFSADGSRLVATKVYGVYVYDMAGLKPLRFIDTGNVIPYRVFFLSDGRTLMTSSDWQFWWPRGAAFFDSSSGQRAGVIRVPPAPNPETGTIGRLSRDGHTLVLQSGTWGLIYDSVSRQPLPFWPNGFPLSTYAFSPDGKLIATAAGSVTVWEVATHRLVFNATEPNTSVALYPLVAFSPDGQFLATSDGRRLVAWDVVHTKRLFDVLLERLVGVTFVSNGLVFAPNGSAVTIAADGQVMVWHMPDGQAVFHTQGGSLAFSPDSATAVVSGRNNLVTLWNMATGQKRVDLSGSAPQFAPDGRLLINSGGHAFAFVDPLTGQTLATFTAQRPHFAPNGQLIDIPDDASVHLLDANGQLTTTLALPADHSPMTSLDFLPDGRLVMTFANGTVRLQGQSTLSTVAEEQGAWIYQAAVAPDGRRFASASKDGTVALFNADDFLKAPWPLRPQYGGPPGELTSVAFSPNGQRIAAGSSEGTVKLWDTSTVVVTPTQVLKGHTNWVWSVAFSPDGRQLASASADQTVRIWDLASGTTLRTLSGHLGAVHSVAYAPDGKLLASGDWAGAVKLWNPATGDLVRTFTIPGTQVNQVAFSRDGQVIVAGLGDGTVRLWETAAGRELTTLHAEGGSVWGIAFSVDGGRLAAALNDGSAQVWEVP